MVHKDKWKNVVSEDGLSFSLANCTETLSEKYLALFDVAGDTCG